MSKKLAGIGGEALYIAPLTLGEERIEGERRLPTPRDPCKDDELILGEVKIRIKAPVAPSPFYGSLSPVSWSLGKVVIVTFLSDCRLRGDF